MKNPQLRFHNLRLSLFAALSITLSGGVTAQSMTDLGTLGGTSSSAYGVSADGSVIVGSSTSAINQYAFKYVGTTMTSLGTLGGGAYSSAWGVSSDGQVIIGDSDSTGNLLHAFKYVGTTMTDLGTFGGSYSSARAASADGSVIVGGSQYPSSDVHAFKYVGTTMTDLGTLGGDFSFANGVSADGSVIVGESWLPSGSNHAFKYVGTTMTDLGTLGGSESKAYGVSSDGTVIVGQSDTTGDAASHAFKYVGTTMTSLGTLGGAASIAWAVSADGKVIVGESYITDDAAIHAFKYVGTTMTDLGTLGGDFSFARGVSADGSVIVGESLTASGDIHAFVYNNTVDSGVLVDVNNTYSSIATNSYQLNSLLNSQNTALAVNLNSDCTVFGANNVCVGVGGRYTNVSSPATSQTASNIQLGYRFAPSFRAGVFLDQGISNTAPNNYTVKNSQPLAGLFAVYAPSGTNLGVQVKASAAYRSNGVNITRTTLANTEAGQGSSKMTSRGAQLETAYGFTVDDSWVASPLAGIRATSVVRNGYTETAGATFPITYNSVSQTATTAYAGAKVTGYVTPTVSVGASAGVEQDLSSNISNNSGSIYYLGAFSLAAPTISQTRPFVAANVDYWIEKNQRVSLSTYYNKQSLNTSNGITAILNYTVGL